MKKKGSEDAPKPEIYGLYGLIEELTDCVKQKMNLIACSPSADTEAGRVISDAVDLSGKMIRPRLLLLCGALGPLWNDKRERLCILAAMVELTHLASLIHDDIVDEAPYRRGKPSIHSRYGRNAAVYAGDFLIARIYHYQAENSLNEPGAVISEAIEQMCAGEIGQDACRYNEAVSAETYLRNVKGKTAALFKAACRIGARETGCSEGMVGKLETFGENIGFMLQLRDDLLDFTSDGKDLGKEVHRDFLSGIYTMPLIKALEHSEAQTVLLPVMRENAQRPLSVEEITAMEEKVIRFGGVEKTCGVIKELAEKNEKILGTIEGNKETVTLMRKITALLKV